MPDPTQDLTMKSGRTDRRKSLRYPITGRAWFQWQSADGGWHDGIGITRDIGKSGVFIESDSAPPVGSAFKLIVALPAGWESRSTLCLRGSGHVCHILWEANQTAGFGASAAFNVEAPMSGV